MPDLEVIQRDGSRHTILYDEADARLIERYTWGVWQRTPDLFYAVTNLPWPGGGYVQAKMHILLTGQRWIDHRNLNGLDNRRENLRPATFGQNRANRRGWSRTGYKGVRQRPSGRWQAEIRADGHKRYLGTFDTPEEAAAAYSTAAMTIWGEYARTNDA